MALKRLYQQMHRPVKERAAAWRADRVYGRKGRDVPVTVILTCYNTERWIDEAVASVLSQTHRHFELILLDDAGTDGSLEKMKEWRRRDPRVRLFAAQKNVGAYVCRNFGFLKSSHNVVTFHDADDVSHPRRLARQLGALLGRDQAYGCACRADYRDEIMRPIHINGRRSGLAHVTLMLKKDRALSEVGYFDTVRFGADTEYVDRINAARGRHGIFLPPIVVYLNRHHKDSITRSGEGSHEWRRDADGTQWRTSSPVRQSYYDASRRWHGEASRKGERPYLAFPLTPGRDSHPFPLPEGMMPRHTMTMAEIDDLFSEYLP